MCAGAVLQGRVRERGDRIRCKCMPGDSQYLERRQEPDHNAVFLDGGVGSA
jgi:hypothetical protein